MRVPIEWLKELVSFRAGADQLAEMLTMAGLETQALPNDVLEVSVLPNRADCWSILGVAREVSALTKFKLKSRRVKVKESAKKISKFLRVEVRDAKLCPRYMARAIEDVKVGESPAWLKKRLEAAGTRPINNVVDITNYLLLELGQPLHAFDANSVAGGEIIVRRANPGEKIITLDGVKHILKADVLVIADSEKAVAVAGIMGGSNSEINQNTANIILESAFFNPVSIHKTAKRLKTRSESSVRFEHGVDWQMVEEALDRAAAMIAELGKGRVMGGKIDVQGKAVKPQVIELRYEKVNQALGAEIPEGDMKAILARLGYKVTGKKVVVPLYRLTDTYREIDLIEEIARIYGYGRIPATMPNTSFPGKEREKEDSFRSHVKEILAGCGFNEIQTYSMIGPRDLEKVGVPVEKAIAIDNPMKVEESLMRPMLLPSLLNVLVYNLNRQVENVLVFEVGKVYLPSGQKLPEEKWKLCAAACGSPLMSAMDKGRIDYYYLKGVLENILRTLGIEDASFIEASNGLLQPGKAAEILGLGIIGELHPQVRQNYDLAVPVYFFEIDLTALFKRLNFERRYAPLPNFPFIARDISMFIPKDVENQMICSLVKRVGGEMVENVFPFDKYQDSMAYRVIYRAANKTLTDDEVNAKHAEIIKALETKLLVRVR
ncbi:MAG: phenylalanine--tRNA ligase subunit beta [Candidatus Margulisbacteria bacterium]|nr:phenylalanine--tRNA ligase subunit beta [Candidatus Margulisiibacteriota bacterium]